MVRSASASQMPKLNKSQACVFALLIRLQRDWVELATFLATRVSTQGESQMFPILILIFLLELPCISNNNKSVLIKRNQKLCNHTSYNWQHNWRKHRGSSSSYFPLDFLTRRTGAHRLSLIATFVAFLPTNTSRCRRCCYEQSVQRWRRVCVTFDVSHDAFCRYQQKMTVRCHMPVRRNLLFFFHIASFNHIQTNRQIVCVYFSVSQTKIRKQTIELNASQISAHKFRIELFYFLRMSIFYAIASHLCEGKNVAGNWIHWTLSSSLVSLARVQFNRFLETNCCDCHLPPLDAMESDTLVSNLDWIIQWTLTITFYIISPDSRRVWLRKDFINWF